MSGVPFTFATAVSNIPLLELDVCFATQVTIGTTQVGLGNTANSLTGLVNVSTSNLIVGGGDTISTFISGTFVPTDQSGAALSFTINRAVYTQIGTRVWAEISLVYPGTLSAASAVIGLGALPSCANVTGASGMWVMYYGGTTFLMGIMTKGTNTFGIYTSAGAATQNSVLTGATLDMQFNYSTV